MAGPVLARLDHTVGDSSGRDYSEQLKAMYLYMRDTRNLFSSTYGLWYRDQAAKSVLTENGLPEFWGRGNGWVIGGLVRVLEELGDAHPDWDLYASMLQTMSASLIPLQQADGCWRSSLVDPGAPHWDNPETSASTLITYGLAWGVNNGVLDETVFRPVIERAWNGLVAVALHPDGTVGYVQGVARSPGSATYDDTADYGVGAFLLAASEVSLLAEEPTVFTDAGPDQVLVDFDMDGEEAVSLDGTGTVDSNDVAVTYEWVDDGQVIATGQQAVVTFPLGLHGVYLQVTDVNSNVWKDALIVQVRHTLPPFPVAGPDQVVPDNDLNGEEFVTLDGSETYDPDGNVATYEWILSNTVVETQSVATLLLGKGHYTFTLRVTDVEGVIREDDIDITVGDAIWDLFASASQDMNLPENTLDSDLSTRWSSSGTQWIQYDLNMITLIKSVSLAFYFGDVRSSYFAIELSRDGTDWVRVFNGESSGTSLQLEEFDFEDTPARYVCIIGFGNSDSAWNSYTEVDIDWELSSYDGNTNGLPDAWENAFAGGLLDDVQVDADEDGRSAFEEWIWGSYPLRADEASPLVVNQGANGLPEVVFQARAAVGAGYAGLKRFYRLEATSSLNDASWTAVPGIERMLGQNMVVTGLVDQADEHQFYRLNVELVEGP